MDGLLIKDKRNNKASESYYDVSGKACLSKDGLAKVEFRYDERGNNVSESYYDLDGKPCRRKDLEVAALKWSYDERGNNVSESYYDLDGKPCLVEGCAKVEWSYDERDNKIIETNYGLNNQPCTNKEGVAKIRFIYDQFTKKEEVYYDLNSNIINTVKFDEQNKE